MTASDDGLSPLGQPTTDTSDITDALDIVLPLETVAGPRLSHVSAAAVVAAALLVAGAALGLLWSVVAPSVRGVIADTRDNGRVHVYLGDQADNFFLSATLLIGFTAVLAVVAAVAAWQWQVHRGPIMVWGLTFGALGSALVAAGVGALAARWRYGVLDVAGAQLDAGHRIKYVLEAPAVFYGHSPGQLAVTVILAPLAAAATYACCVMACARDDLGAWPPVAPPAAWPSARPEAAPISTGGPVDGAMGAGRHDDRS